MKAHDERAVQPIDVVGQSGAELEATRRDRVHQVEHAGRVAAYGTDLDWNADGSITWKFRRIIVR